MKFGLAQLCMTLAALSPLLFLTADGLWALSLLAAPFYLLLMLWARVNAAAAMRDSLGGGRLCGYRLWETESYGRKLGYGLSRCALLLLWGSPLIACVVIARVNMAGETDGCTVLRMIKKFGGGDLTTGVLYLALILLAALLLFAFGCAFHSGDRHAFVRNQPKLTKGRHGGILRCWLAALIAVLPMLAAFVVLVFRYLPVLDDLTGLVSGNASLPSTKGTLLIAGVGAALTMPLLPLRSLITAAWMQGAAEEEEKKAETAASAEDSRP